MTKPLGNINGEELRQMNDITTQEAKLYAAVVEQAKEDLEGNSTPMFIGALEWAFLEDGDESDICSLPYYCAMLGWDVGRVRLALRRCLTRDRELLLREMLLSKEEVYAS